jgi:hypothetical protein
MLKPHIANVTGTTIVLALLVGCATVDTGSISGSNYGSMPAENILGLLNHPEDIKNSFNRQERRIFQDCYGGRADFCAVVGGSDAYQLVHEDDDGLFVGTDPGAGFKALMLGCAYDAQPDHGAAQNCNLLSVHLYKIGNIEGAKAIIQHAPGCHSFTVGGDPQDRCFDGFLIDSLRLVVKGLLTPDETMALARSALSYARSDYTAAQYISSHGGTANVAAAQQAHQEARANSREVVQQHNDAIDKVEAARDARRDAVLGSLREMPGASDPNAIVNAGNQQAAAIRAIGDANAARQQQDAQMRLTQRTTLPSASQASSIVAGPATTYQSPAQVVTSSGAPPSVTNPSAASGGTSHGSVGSGAIQYLTPLAASCVRQFWDPRQYNWLSFENDCGQAIYVTYIPHRPGGWAMGGAMHLAPGNYRNTGLSSDDNNNSGGFDLYVCPTDSVPVDLSGNVFNVNVAQYRCKPQ